MSVIPLVETSMSKCLKRSPPHSDPGGGEPDPEPVEVPRGGQELREQGHVEDPPAGAGAELQQRVEGGERLDVK